MNLEVARMGVDDLVKLIDAIDTNSKIVSEVTSITKSILAKDPDALNNTLAEYVIKSHLGESMYDKIQNIYHDIIGTKGDQNGRICKE